MRRTHLRGFTLVELLVVISIIAILAAILFPVLARARESARKAHCVANVRQLLMAERMYNDDNDRTLVPARAGVAPAPSLGYTWCILLQPYMKNTQILICPTDSDPETAQSSTDLKHSYGINYLMTFNRTVGGGYPFTTKMGTVDRAADLILFFEIKGSAQAMGTSITSDSYSRIDARHNGLSVYGFLDGHAKPLRLQEVRTTTAWDPYSG